MQYVYGQATDIKRPHKSAAFRVATRLLLRQDALSKSMKSQDSCNGFNLGCQIDRSSYSSA